MENMENKQSTDILAEEKAFCSRGAVLKRGVWFFILSALLAGLVSLNYFRQLSIDFSGEGWVYALFTMFGHFAMWALVAWVAFCLPWALAFPRKPVAAILSVAAGTAGLALVLLDTFVFGLYRYHVYNGFVLELLFGDGAAGIFVFTAGQILLMIGAAVAVVASGVGLWFAARFLASRCGKKALIPAVAVLLVSLIASHMMHAYYSANGSRSVYQIAEVYPGHFPLTANRFLIKHGFVDPEKVREKIKLNAGTALAYPRAELVSTQVPTKNILVIFIDSWNFRTFTPEVMPNACEFAKNAQVFTEHYSGDHGTRTGVISLFHGLPGHYFYAIRDGGVSSAFIDTLVKNKYEMGIYATASLANPPFTRTIFKNVPEGVMSYNLSDGVSTAEGDEKTADAWLDFTKKYTSVPAAERKPFFGFLFFDELHAMTMPKDAEKKFPTTWENPKYEMLGKDTDPTEFFNLYQNCAYWLDAQLKRVFDDLRERGLLENTVVVLTGDHGQEFNEDGNNTWGHGNGFSEHQLKVPFVLFDAALPPKTYSHWTAHYDVTVSLLQNYLHVQNPPSDFSVGKNLFDETPREWLLVGHPEQWALVEKDRITHVKMGGSYEIYDRNYRFIPDAKLNVPVFHAALEQSKCFYKKD
ncbi:MAG: DUF3413 domain-containing protein [Verrucomicrobia bacterium]|nr:DUF3413 domain-containing protein [Verrucomicrobiota bacterium]